MIMSEATTEPSQSLNTEQNQNLPSPNTLAEKRNELETARKEYFAVAELVQQRKKEVNEAWEVFGQYVDEQNNLVAERDSLNIELREKRKAIKQRELDLANAKEELRELEEVTENIRKEIPKTKGKLTQAYQDHESAKRRVSEAAGSLDLVTQKVREAEAVFLAAGGNLPKKELLILEEPNDKNRQNPWISGSFYVIAVVLLMTVLAVISANVPWYALIFVIIGGLLTIAIVGALQLRQDERLSEENFITLMIESIKRLSLLRGLPLLKGGNRSEQEIKESQPQKNPEN
jgi:hypothetical protein